MLIVPENFCGISRGGKGEDIISVDEEEYNREGENSVPCGECEFLAVW